MKSLLIALVLAATPLWLGYDLVAIRTAYADAAKNRAGLTRLQQILAPLDSNVSPVLTCYKGAAQIMIARYAINPLTKLSAFSRGRQLIESAISSDSLNVECRFIRYGIQRNLPAMLNYRDQIISDSLIIVKGLNTLNDQDLKQRIMSYLKK